MSKTINTVGGGAMPKAWLRATAPTGSVVTAALGSTVLTAAEDSGCWFFNLTGYGTWTVSASLAGSIKTATVEINHQMLYEMEIDYLPVPAETLDDTTWDVISEISEAGKAQKYWSVGDTKTISVNGVSYVAQIIGFDHDPKTDGGLSGITFQLQDMLATTYKMNSSNTNANGWRGSNMRTSTMATLLTQLSTDLQSVIKAVNKDTNSGSKNYTIETTSDKLFLLSEVEVFGAVDQSYPGEGRQYAYYASGNPRIKEKSGTACDWWGRSPRHDTGGFGFVDSTGGADGSSASYQIGVSFAFCV